VTTALRARFLLDPDVCYLNHGAFGAAPIPVFEAYQAWQRELERQPTRFLTRTLEPALAGARRELAGYVGAGEDDLTFVPNATTGVNVVARSIHLEPGDEILSCDHEYGACDLPGGRHAGRRGPTTARSSCRCRSLRTASSRRSPRPSPGGRGRCT
jgi:isopenicillin-N epimerase